MSGSAKRTPSPRSSSRSPRLVPPVEPERLARIVKLGKDPAARHLLYGAAEAVIALGENPQAIERFIERIDFELSILRDVPAMIESVRHCVVENADGESHLRFAPHVSRCGEGIVNGFLDMLKGRY